MEELKQKVLYEIFYSENPDEDEDYHRGMFDAYLFVLEQINTQLGKPKQDGLEEARRQYIQSFC